MRDKRRPYLRRPLATASAVLTLSTAIVAVPLALTSAAAGSVYYVAPSGNDSAAGTQAAPWASIARAQTAAQPGDTVYFRGGTYAYTKANSSCASQTARVDAVTLNKSGSAGNLITYRAYPGEKPVFNFSKMTDDCRIKGFDVTGSYLQLNGLEVTGVPQTNTLNHESWGIWISGSNNVFEQINTHHHMGPGLFINGGAGNLVLNSDSHDNYDQRSSNGAGESGDGFGSHYTPAGQASNIFRGDRAWNNSDDGFDLISTYSPVLIENSWAWRNGYVPGTTTASGNGNGFKVGGFGGEYDAGAVKHTVRLSVAFLNRAAGFYSNHHPVANDYFNNTSYGNHPDFNMLGVDTAGAAVGRGNLRNNIAYTGTLTSNMSGTTAANNSWDLGLSLSDAQFQSVSTSGWDAARRSDGSLPVPPGFRLAANSTLIDKGVDVGLGYDGRAPDLGAFEFSTATGTTTTTSTTTSTTKTSATSTTSTSRPAQTTTTTTTTMNGGTGSEACTATLTVSSTWSGGFVGDVTVTAGRALTGWKVALTLPSGTAIVGVWNGVSTGTTGTVSVTNASYNGTLSAGQATSFGFQGSGGATGIGGIACTSV